MRRPSLTSATAVLLGVFYLLSGIGKALGMAQFTATIAGYGLPQLAVLAHGLIALEMGLGAALVLRVQLRRMALLSLVLLALFTALFAYGYLVRGVRDCGCFGALDALALPPALSFLRNALLLGLSGWLYRRAPQPEPKPAASPLGVLLAVGTAVLSFLVLGATYSQRTDPMKVGVEPGQSLRGSRLAPFVPAGAADSTYAVFLFSPACPHCWDATPTVASYQGQGVVSRVIALHAPADSAQVGKYVRHFHPPFALRVVARDSFRAIAQRVPALVLVRRGRVLRVLRPPLPPADSLQAMLAAPMPKQ